MLVRIRITTVCIFHITPKFYYREILCINSEYRCGRWIGNDAVVHVEINDNNEVTRIWLLFPENERKFMVKARSVA